MKTTKKSFFIFWSEIEKNLIKWLGKFDCRVLRKGIKIVRETKEIGEKVRDFNVKQKV